MSLDRYRSVEAVAAGEPIATREVAARLRVSWSTASHLLASLANRGLATRIRPGLWVIGEDRPDPYVVAATLLAPAPSYVSFASALGYRGVIDQLPRDIAVASTGRPRRVKTALGVFDVHRVPPALFGGWSLERGAQIATVEKAIFDIAYNAAARRRPARVPELDLPKEFSEDQARRWVGRISDPRFRGMTELRLYGLLDRADA
jgi:predicted transcriptional regulator of viral defense system